LKNIAEQCTSEDAASYQKKNYLIKEDDSVKT
jgi:hypothetical protein